MCSYVPPGCVEASHIATQSSDMEALQACAACKGEALEGSIKLKRCRPKQRACRQLRAMFSAAFLRAWPKGGNSQAFLNVEMIPILLVLRITLRRCCSSNLQARNADQSTRKGLERP